MLTKALVCLAARAAAVCGSGTAALPGLRGLPPEPSMARPVVAVVAVRSAWPYTSELIYLG